MFYKLFVIFVGIIIFAACGRTGEIENIDYAENMEYIDTLTELEPPEYSQYSWTLAIPPTFDFVTDFYDGLASY